MDDTKGWRNVSAHVEYIEEGEEISIEIEGGFTRKKAPCAGLVVTDRKDRTIFVPNLAGYLGMEKPKIEMVISLPQLPQPELPSTGDE